MRAWTWTMAMVIAVAAPAGARAGLDDTRDDDAAASRTYLGSTGLVAPAGRGTLSARVVLPVAVVGVTYGIAGRLEVGAGGTTWWILDESTDPDHAVFADAKVQVWRNQRVALALAASLTRREAYHGLEDPVNTPDVPALVSGFATAAATVCVDPRCAVVLHGHLDVARDLAGGDRRGLGGGLAVVAGHPGARTHVIADILYDSFEPDADLAAFAGVRFAGSAASLDLGCIVVHYEVRHWLPWPAIGISARL